MPFIPTSEVEQGPRYFEGTLSAEPPAPSMGDLIGSAFRRYNTVVSSYNFLNARTGLTPVPGYDPMADIRGTKYEQNHLDAFAASESPAETRLIMSGIDQDEHDNATIARGGWGGTVAALAAGMLDPTIFIPLGPAYDAFRGSLSALRSGASLGATAAVQAAAQQAVLQATHPTETPWDTAKAVGSAALLGGLLGGAIRFLSPAERAMTEAAFDRDRVAMGNEIAGAEPTAPLRNALSVDPSKIKSGTPLPALKIGGEVFVGDNHAEALERAIKQFGANSPEVRAFNDAENPLESIGVVMGRKFLPNVSGDAGQDVLRASREAAAAAPPTELPETPVSPQAASAGSAAADLRQLVLQPTFGLAEFINKTPYLRAAIGAPTTQAFMSPFLSLRRGMADLAETSLVFGDALRGIAPTKEGGPAVDRLVRMLSDKGRYDAGEVLDRLYAKYATGQSDLNYVGQQVAKVKGMLEEMRAVPDRKLSPGEFRNAVGRAMRRSDTSNIPEVQQAAEELRRKVYEPWKERAIKAGIFGEDVAPETAESYFMRMYDNDKIRKTLPQFQQRIADWLGSEQATKANLQTQIQREWDNLRQARIEGRKMEGRIATAESRLSDLESRLSEREGETTAALKRQGTVEARNQEAQAALKELRDYVKELRDRGANTQEIRDQIREMEANIAEIERGSQLINEKDLAAIDKAERDGILTGNMRRVARVVTGKAKAPKPPSFWRWLADNGGVKGDDLNIDALAAPGLIRKNGMAWDEVQRKLAGEFPELRARGFGHVEGRPAEDFGDEIRNAVQESIAGNEPDWFLAEKWNDSDRMVAEWSAMLDRAAHDAGVTFKSINDVADFFRGEHEGMTEADYDAIVRSVEEGTGAPAIRAGAEDLAARIGIRQGSIDLFKDALANAKKKAASAETKAKVAEARSGEAGVAKNRNLGRLGILNERARVGQKQRDFLEAMRAKAADNEEMARARLEDLLNSWEGKSTDAVKAALARRGEAESARATKGYMKGAPSEGARLSSADTAVDSTVRGILKQDLNQTPQEHYDRAGEIIGRILGTPDGRLPYDMGSGGPRIGAGTKGIEFSQARGPLHTREFMIPDKLIEDWLVSDAGHVTDRFLHTIVPDVLLTERFGDVEMQSVFKELESEYLQQANAATSEKQRAKLRDEYERGVANLAAVRDRVRHVYGWSPDYNVQKAARVAQSLKRYNFMTQGGQFALSSLSDLAGPILLHGLDQALGSGWRPFIKSLASAEGAANWKAITNELKAAGIGFETQLGSRIHQWEDIGAMYAPVSKFERALAASSDTFGMATGLSLWTDLGKNVTATVVMNNMLKAIERVAAGQGTKKEIANLAESGIDQAMAGRIWENYSREGGGGIVDGVRLPNTGVWSDAKAREAFQGAVSRGTDIGIITPGQEKPLWMSRPMASLIGQYRSFTAAGTERLLLRGLQKRDFNIAQGVVFATLAGMMSSAITGILNGNDLSQRRPMDWVKEGMSRGGVLGWLEEGNGMAAKMTSGRADLYRLIGADKPLTRYQTRSVLGALLGPTADKIDVLQNVTGAAARGDWKASDTSRLRRLAPLQNMVGLNKIFDVGVNGLNRQLGVQ